MQRQAGRQVLRNAGSGSAGVGQGDNAHEHLAGHGGGWCAAAVVGARSGPVGTGDASDRAFRDFAERVDLGTIP